MIIIAGGDSFVYGSELQDSKNTFLSLLAKDYVYNCVAWPGYANDSIARTVITECQKNKKNCIVVVSWTFPGRYEFRFNYNTEQKKSPWYAFNHWTVENTVANIKKEFKTQHNPTLHEQISSIHRAKRNGIVEFANSFYKHIGSSEYWETYATLKEIVYLQNYLKLNNVPYLFTCADSSVLYNYTIRNSDEFVSSLYEQIDFTSWFLFPPGLGADQTETPRGFYQWAIENKYPIGTTHPLEQAHSDAANLIRGKFNELVKKFAGHDQIRNQIPS